MPDTPIIITLVILLGAAALFVTERLRVDLVALLVLASLAVTGLVTPAQALSGFSNAAVVTVWAMFVISGALSRTGVANIIGRQTLRLAGQGEVRLIVVVMLTAGILSAFMNNVGVAALFLPVVMDVARKTGHRPSKLLMPLAFGSLLGGLTTLIGTPPNILASDALRHSGFAPFRMFDYTPFGAILLVSGVAFVALFGSRLLPNRDLTKESTPGRRELEQAYDLRVRLFHLRLPADSALVGKTLAQSRLGSALGLNVVAVFRGKGTQFSPDPSLILKAGDKMLVSGRQDQLTELKERLPLVQEEDSLTVERLVSSEIELVEVGLVSESALLGKTLQQIDFRRRYGVNVLAILKNGVPKRTGLGNVALQAGDRLLIQGSHREIESLRTSADFVVSSDVASANTFSIHERLIAVRVPEGSALVGKTLAESHLGDAFGLTGLGIVRGGITQLMPEPTEKLLAGDILLVQGKTEDLGIMLGLQALEIESEAELDPSMLETDQVGMVEAVLSPHTTLAGKTLRELHFREKYGVSVLAIWREGRAYRSNLRDMELRFGDALLLYGPRSKLNVVGSEPDFLVLAQAAQEPPRLERAPVAALVMAGILVLVILGWLPISIAAVTGAALMILFGCLTMEEAYRFIEWKAVFLIAGMLPLGIAMEQSGAGQFLASGVVRLVAAWGPLAALMGVFIPTSLATQVMPSPAVLVLMAPIALNAAAELGLSPYAVMMAVAVAASASFLSPVSHPANVLIMGPGGYRFSDYLRLGLPLTGVVLVATLLVMPIFWPLVP